MESLAADLATMVRTPLAPEHVARLRAVGRPVDFAPGDTLIAFGQPSDALFYLLEGEVAPYDELTGERYGTATLGPAQFTGEISLLNGGSAMLTNRAVLPTRTIRVERADLMALMAEIPEMSDIIIGVFSARRRRLVESNQGGLTLIGSESDRRVRRIAAFAGQNRIPFRSLEIGSEPALRAAEACGLAPGASAVIVGERTVVADPTPRSVAAVLGLDLSIGPGLAFDVLIVGGGPAGIAAGLYAGAEGLSALVVDELSIGGQAGTSSRIDNYMGFPTGISGADLCWRGEVQALKFGTRFAVPRRIQTVVPQPDGGFLATLDDGCTVAARSLVIAAGVQYRRLPLDRLEDLEGAGVYYAATEIEARFCQGSDVVVVGGGNSAGQAAMFLSRRARRVHMLVRGASLASSMSDYLIGRLQRNPAVDIRYGAELAALHGEDHLEAVTIRDRRSGAEETVAARGAFVMVGAAPDTGWLGELVALDRSGFVVTGAADGSPYATSRPGVFAVGDVRAGSTKRVASAVGEGSVVVSHVWTHLNR